jgi:protein tyrosine/serine phosphatase
MQIKSLTRLSVLRIVLVLLLFSFLAGCPSGLFVPVGDGVLYNFYPIEEGKAYRSAQPSPGGLAAAIEEYGLRTVVNLRGHNPDKEWYQNEADVCATYGVTLADHAMSSSSLPSAELLESITETLMEAEYPILIHCQGGADRSGAVAAIYRMLIMGHSREEAKEALSTKYFHFVHEAPCMDTLIDIYEPGSAWLAEYADYSETLECTP